MSIKRNAAETLGYLGANKKRKIDKRESGELEEDASEEEVEEDVAEKKVSFYFSFFLQCHRRG